MTRDSAVSERRLQTLSEDAAVREAVHQMAEPLLDALDLAPDPDAAAVGLSRFLAARASKVMFLRYLREDPAALAALVELLGTSPHLTETLIRNPEYFDALMPQLAGVHGSEPAASAVEEPRPVPSLDALKRLKRQRVLVIAARDILGRDSLEAATRQLSTLASLIVDRALDFVKVERLAAEHLDRLPGRFAVIGMGKLGGQELNYSSDIDLMYVYEPDSENDPEAHAVFQRLARTLTTTLTEHTAESYFYRVDLRLRPMGRAGNIAHSLEQFKEYYDTWGVTFERFALIKARPIAGDADLGSRFVDQVQSFVYRRYLDHAAVEEMYQHKASVDRAIAVAARERNVKLGRGGIREVELFTQVLQLTYGARLPALRQQNTLAGLAVLEQTGLISASVRAELAEAYVFLRTVEHRLQIVLDSQTHTLPESREELEICARRLRFTSADELESTLESRRARVHELYQDLFERRRGATSFEARQFFRILGDEVTDEEALAHLAGIGFRDPDAALNAIRGLGRQGAFTGAPTTARNLVANFLASAAPRIVSCATPEVVLLRFEQLAEQAGGALLARSLLENPVLCDVLIDVLDHGEFLAQRLVQHPELLDALALPVPSADALRRSFESSLARMERLALAARLTELRRFKRSEEFKIIVGWLATGSLDDLCDRLSFLADYAVAQAARWHAPAGLDAPAASWAVMALGKLGGEELTVHSDLDLVFVYEDEMDPSDADARWQSFVERTQNFLATPTAEGVAYRIDTRLRPEGTKGPLAVPVDALARYFEERAESWERLAWTRAQVLVGSRELSKRLRGMVEAFVYGPWQPEIPQYMHHIRMRMERELAKDPSKLDVKVGAGGLTDIDFILELVQIYEGQRDPAFRIGGSRRLLAKLPSTRFLDPDESRRLTEAYRFLRTVETLVRLKADSNVSRISTDPVVMNPVGTRMGFGDAPGGRLLARYRELTERVRAIYTAVLTRFE
jgi:glutamate-ammonia-ligase adenylyltransferase